MESSHHDDRIFMFAAMQAVPPDDEAELFEFLLTACGPAAAADAVAGFCSMEAEIRSSTR